MELELKHIAPLFPHGLQMEYNGQVGTLTEVHHNECEPNPTRLAVKFDGVRGCMEPKYIWLFKPVVRPLSQLTEEITHNGKTFVPIDFLDMYPEDLRIIIKHGAIEANMNWHDAQKLFEWHFDAFGLIDSGLAIEKPNH